MIAAVPRARMGKETRGVGGHLMSLIVGDMVAWREQPRAEHLAVLS